MPCDGRPCPDRSCHNLWALLRWRPSIAVRLWPVWHWYLDFMGVTQLDGFMENPRWFGATHMSKNMTCSHTCGSQKHLPVLPVSGPMVEDVLEFLATHRHSWAHCSNIVCSHVLSVSQLYQSHWVGENLLESWFYQVGVCLETYPLNPFWDKKSWPTHLALSNCLGNTNQLQPCWQNKWMALSKLHAWLGLELQIWCMQ